MSRIERIYQIEQILTARRSATREQLLEALGVSRATLKRDLQYLRDRLNAPIEWDSELRAYSGEREHLYRRNVNTHFPTH